MIFNTFFAFNKGEENFSNEIKNIFSEDDFQKIFSEIQNFLPDNKKNFYKKFLDKNFFEDKEINLFFVSNSEIKKLNKKFRNKNSETDCLSFEKNNEDKNSPFDPVFGECFIAMPYIKNQAEKYGVSLKFEITKMIIHSVLHIYGYDHIEDKDFEEMNNLEKKIMGKFDFFEKYEK